MGFWPFGKKRRAAKDSAPEPVSEKPVLQAQDVSRVVTARPGPTRTPTHDGQRRLRARSPAPPPPPPSPPILALDEKTEEPPPEIPARAERRRQPQAATVDQELKRVSTRQSSVEDVSALPMSRRLDHSPHLRPVEVDRTYPYNARTYSGSQPSVNRQTSIRSRPGTLHSKRSTHESGQPTLRHQPSKKRPRDPKREKEIRALNETRPIPIPRRPGTGDESISRKESRRGRADGAKDSLASLPPADASVYSAASGGASPQRGWEIGILDVLNPRPVVRLSGVPQYVAPDLNASGTSLMAQELSRREEKMPEKQSTGRKRQTIGNRADDLDATDLRAILERDTKRRQRKLKEHQEKLDRKLRRERNRDDSSRDQMRREAEQALQRAREVTTPPTDIHPAFRDRREEEEALLGLGIVDAEEAAERTRETEDPFADPIVDRPVTPLDDSPASPTPFDAPATPLEDLPVISTAQAVQISHPRTAPVSPLSPLSPLEQLSMPTATSRPVAQPSALDTRRISEPPRDPNRRSNTWATFFRRSTVRKSGATGSDTPDLSFSNTSRESMRNQSLPAHLAVDHSLSAVSRRRSETPIRTQSRFKEDLPESSFPQSPPQSRLSSPEIASAATTAALAQLVNTAEPVDIPEESNTFTSSTGRNDTPVSPSMRGHGLMSSSLASIDSEGSWLAGGSKRQSTQSALSRSLSKRGLGGHASSYENLGGDRDAEYFQRLTPEPEQAMPTTTNQEKAASPDDGSSNYGDEVALVETADPLTVHQSVRRRPTLVHGDARVKSREGLLTDMETPDRTSAVTDALSDEVPDDIEPESENQVQRATSISYGRGHARQISAGSARLFNIHRRQESQDQPVPPVPVSPPASPNRTN